MDMSVTERLANAFKRWSETRQPPSNDDANGLVRVDALAAAATGSGGVRALGGKYVLGERAAAAQTP